MLSTLILLSIGIPWFGAFLLWLAGDGKPRLQHSLAVMFALGGGAAALAMIPLASSEVALVIPVGAVFGDFTFIADGLGVFLAAVAAVIGSLAVIFSVDYMHGEHQLSRYYAFVLFFIGGMVGLVLTSNLLLMFFFWEITALCSYALISFHNDDPKAVAGGMKALVITQLGGIGLLLGALLLFAHTGNYDITALLANPGILPAGMLAFMAFGALAAAAAKSAQFPFQTWLPDAMEAPTPISALIHAATMVNAGVYLLARFYPAFKDVPYWPLAVMLVGVITALMAALMALSANDLKRVLAYSTVSQLGYMVYAVGAGGIFAAQFHLFSHAIFKALLFLSAGAVIHAVGTRDMREMGGLGRQMPLTRAVFVTGALALAGLPIFNGSWSKELVLEAGLKAAEAGGTLWMYILMVITAGLTALYTFRMVAMVFYGQPRTERHVHDAGAAMKVALVPLALATLVSWLAVGPFSRLLDEHTLPYHHLEAEPTLVWLKEVLAWPTLIVLAVVAAGILAWFGREKLAGITQFLRGLNWAASNSFGFEAVNRAVVAAVGWLAEKLRAFQTGQLNWNIFGLAAALVVVLAILLAGA